jgi:hypothetical protein
MTITARNFKPDPKIVEFMRFLWNNIEYWDKHGENQRNAIEGVIFSTLVMFDGDSPECDPPGTDVMNCHYLHELFHGFGPEK